MTARELMEQLRIINQERMLATLHVLSIKKPSDKLTVAEIFREADIDF